jgi:uncharacterized protein (TIGR02246 family)
MNDEQAIHEMHDRFAEAWSRGDAKTAASFMTADAVRVGAGGDVQHGPAEIEAALARLTSGPFKGATVHIEHGSVRRLGEGLALWQAPMEIRPGGERPPIRGYVVDVMKKEGADWRILETHPKLFPPPPPR